MSTKDIGSKDNVHGEGNYEATRQYNSATKKFVESGRVEQAARDAEPRSGKEAAEMKQAEAGRPAAREARARRVHRRRDGQRPRRRRHVPLTLRCDGRSPIMLRYAIVFLVIAIIAALFGFGGIAAGATEIAKLLFFVFLVLFIVSLVAGMMRRGP